MKSTTFGSMIAAVLLGAGTMAACQNSPTTVPEHTHGTAPPHSHALQELGPYRVTGQELYAEKKLPPTVHEDRLVRVEVSRDKRIWVSAPWSIYFTNTRVTATIDYSLQDNRITVFCRLYNGALCQPSSDFHFRIYVSSAEAPSN